ncbi:MAG TPA: FliM/FliN family flagellar motor switch protein [Rhizomicrobium sp.]|nr:FliM/FliN family flagellar motor switch protein [Rhizomicrobium sp.]
MSVSTMRSLETAKTGEKPEGPKPGINSDVLRGVRVSLDARLGKAQLAVEEMMALKPGSVVALTTGLADNVELYLNDVLVARGEVVAVDNKYAIRIVEIAATP